jgi:dTDP-4-amino-4,6-dideoxygalactose transaminase
VKRLRQYGWDRRYHAASPYGRNSRLDEMQAAILRVKLGLLDEWNQRRRAIATQYREATANTDLRLLHEPSESYVAHLCVGVHPARDDLRAALDTAGIDTAVHFPTPDHMQPAIAVRSWKSSGLAVTERAAQSAFSLPCFPELTDAEVCYVCEALRSVL